MADKIIHCPHCGQDFQINENDYAFILNQVRDKEFEQSLEKRVSEELKVQKQKYESDLKVMKLEQENKMKTTLDTAKLQYSEDIKRLQTEVDYYKDLKARSSTKMIGESLEQHCMNEFDKLRATAFPHDYFEKDNEISETGSKGDFIYRAFNNEGNEIVSIMFEMKNEMETTQQKHKNADFFKELDKDRNEKNCEYAVLCSLLETDSDLYNQGIVDVSHRYEKMYVIRPQFFIVIITTLRNAAMKQVQLKQELIHAQRTNIDITELENQVTLFKSSFSKNYELASRKFSDTLSEIDKAILHLQKTKEALLSCDRNLRLANDKTENLTVKNLLKNSPSLAENYK